MANENEASSSASQNNGDGKKTVASANVNAAQVVARFAQAERQQQQNQGATKTAATKAPENAAAAIAGSAPPDEGSRNLFPAAEPATARSPETQTPDKPEGAEAKKPATEEKPDAEVDDVLSPESQTLSKQAKEKIQRRIDKEVSNRKALEAQLEQVKNQLTGLTEQQKRAAAAAQVTAQAAAKIEPDATAPLPDIKDPAALVEYRNQAKQTVRWAEEVLDRDDIDQGVQIGDKTYTKAEIKAIRRNAQAAIEDKIPAQQEFFQQRAQAAQRAAQVYQSAVNAFPFLGEKDNIEVQQAVAFFNESAPAALKSPDAAWILGAYMKGIKAKMAEEAAAKGDGAAGAAETKPAAKPTPPKPKPPGDQTAVSSATTSPRLSPTAATRSALQELEARQKQKGNSSRADTVAYLAAQERLRNGG
jgi:hypothetical protein